MLQHLIVDLLPLLIPNLSVIDLVHLSMTCLRLQSYFCLYFKPNVDSLVPSFWHPIRQYALMQSRTLIFPQMIDFYDLTSILRRCLSQKDEIHFNYFWGIVARYEELNPWNRQISYSNLLSFSVEIDCDLEVMDLFASRLNYVDATGFPELGLILSDLLLIHRDESSQRKLRYLVYHYIPPFWRDWILAKSYETGQSLLFQRRDRSDIDLVIAMRHHDLTSILHFIKQGLTLDRVEIFIQSAIVSGRKDLVVMIESKLGYRPDYRGGLRLLETIENGEMLFWLKSLCQHPYVRS